MEVAEKALSLRLQVSSVKQGPVVVVKPPLPLVVEGDNHADSEEGTTGARLSSDRFVQGVYICA